MDGDKLEGLAEMEKVVLDGIRRGKKEMNNKGRERSGSAGVFEM